MDVDLDRDSDVNLVGHSLTHDTGLSVDDPVAVNIHDQVRVHDRPQAQYR